MTVPNDREDAMSVAEEQPTAAEQDPAGAQAREEVDALISLTDQKEWHLELELENRDGTKFIRHETYVQRPLSYFAKLELFSLLADTLGAAMAQGMSATEVSRMVGNLSGGVLPSLGGEDENRVQAATEWMQTLLSLVSYSPSFAARLYCIALHVPPAEREFAIGAMTTHFTDDDGFEVMERFVDQNAEALEDFFVGRFAQLGKRAAARFKILRERTAEKKAVQPAIDLSGGDPSQP